MHLVVVDPKYISVSIIRIEARQSETKRRNRNQNSIGWWHNFSSGEDNDDLERILTSENKCVIMPTRSEILNAISNDKSFVMFRNVALGDNCTSDDGAISKSKVIRRRYYSRLSEMVRAGLIIRKKRKYYLSSLGKIIYHNQEIIQSALIDYWKLKAIDSVAIFGGPLKEEEHQQFIESLINDHTLKEILTKKNYSYSVKNDNNNILIQNSQCTSICKQKEKPNFSVMLIEDERGTLLTYKTFLSDEAYNVDGFVDSYEAFKHFINMNGHYYDLVVIDIRMPGLNGLQLYRRLRMIDDKLNVIFISALDAVQELTSIFPELNQNNFIKKPATKEEFLNKVKAAVSQMYMTPDPLVRESSN